MSSLLRERFISVNPSLIKTFGLLNAVVLQEIYFTTLTDQVGGGIGECDMSAAEIAGRIGVSKDQVYRAKKDLVEVGAITGIDKPDRSPKAQKSYSADVETIERLSADARIEMANLFAPARKAIRGSANRTPNIPTKEKKKKKKTSGHEQGSLTEEPSTGQDEPDGSPDDAFPSEAIETATKAVEWFNTRRAEVLGEDKHKFSKASVTAMDRLLRLGSPRTEGNQPVTKQELARVCEWVFNHTFWASVVQSPQSLRENWHTIVSQYQRANKTANGTQSLDQLEAWQVGRRVASMIEVSIDSGTGDWLSDLAKRLASTPGGGEIARAIQTATTPAKLKAKHNSGRAAEYITEIVERYRSQLVSTAAA